jgi:hypothetical protein
MSVMVVVVLIFAIRRMETRKQEDLESLFKGFSNASDFNDMKWRVLQ